MKEIKLDFLNKLYDSLSSMIGYADDGVISRDDPDFSDFFRDIDIAEETLEELWNIINALEKEEDK